jgi:hypothetical protein
MAWTPEKHKAQASNVQPIYPQGELAYQTDLVALVCLVLLLFQGAIALIGGGILIFDKNLTLTVNQIIGIGFVWAGFTTLFIAGLIDRKSNIGNVVLDDGGSYPQG